MDIGAQSLDPVSALDLLFEVDYWGYFKSGLFYVMLAICAAQTFYPILMIIAMFIRQLGFLAQYFHEVSVRVARGGHNRLSPPCRSAITVAISRQCPPAA